MLDAIHYTEAREKLDAIMTAVCENDDAVVVTRSNEPPVVIMSLAEYNSLQETAYLLRSPANAERLLSGMRAMDEGRVERHDLIEVDDERD